ncbi:11156_t:CDS:2 [Ambispora gerdemannii]|uniref:Derlin n=1 Tax=Ambispora gerdemannii TaxID=144530 RepID=A0A9N8YQV4_9GLOM|nr:11156_t:CDS:2 [Ambispora gerdemannii]
MSIIYLWSQYNRDKIVTFMFGLTFKAAYFPFVLLAYEFIASKTIPIRSIVGLCSSHLYYFLDELYPASGGPRLTKTPGWLYRYFPSGGSSSGLRRAYGRIFTPNTESQQHSSGYNWGRGRRLGT